jgi:hypothetical protein
MGKTLQELHKPVQGWRPCEHAEKGEWCPTVRKGEFGPCCGDDPDGEYTESSSSLHGVVGVMVCEHCLVTWRGTDLPDDMEDHDVAEVAEMYHRVWPCPTAQAMAEAVTEPADTGRLMAWGA